MSCHMLIKIPSSFEAWTLTWLIVISMFIGMVTVTYFYIRRKMKRKYLLAKIERRGNGIATPSSRRRVDGLEGDATILHERAVKF